MLTRYKQILLPFLLSICIALLLAACTNKQNSTLSADDFEKAIKDTGEKYGVGYKTKDILDSIYQANPGAPVDFKIKYLSFACGFYHIYRGNEDSAMLYADSMLSIVNNRDDKDEFLKEEALANLSKGDIFFARQQYRYAYNYYYLGKLAAEKSTDACTYSEYNYRLGMVTFKQAGFLKAAEYFIKAFEQSKNCTVDFSSTIRRQELLNNISISYNKAGMPDSSIIYHDKTIDFLNKHKDVLSVNPRFYKTAFAVAYGTVARNYVDTDSAKAESYFKQSIAINSQPLYDINDALLQQLGLARLYMHYNNWQAFASTLRSAKTGLDTLRNNKEAAMDWNFLMAELSAKQNNDAGAYKYLAAYEQLRTAQEVEEKNLAKTNVSREIDNMQNTYEISILKHDKKMRSIYLWLLAVSLLFIGIILYLIWKNYIRSKKMIGTLRNMNLQISDQKAAIDKVNNELQKQVQEKDSILRVVAHDLRNPISGIYSSLNYIDRPGRLPEEEMEFIKMMQLACSDALTLISGLLETTGHSEVAEKEKKAIALNPVINHCVQLLLFKAAEKNQLIDIDLSGTELTVFAQEEQVRRLINNLLTNAIKFSHKNGTIKVVVNRNDRFAEVKVIDQGVGIPQKVQGKVFDVSTEAKRFGTNDEKPFGLGLSICKKIVEGNGGKIWFESIEGEGTSFHFTLPLA